MSIRANVSEMTVPGDYTFQVNVTNPGHPDLTAQVVCTVNPASAAPVISSITPSPASPTLPASASQLSAVTSGSTNQPLRHWWAVKMAPAGAKPVFAHQGLPNTTVSNLILPGTYTFTLRAFDDLHMTTRDVALTVNPAPGAPVITSAASASVIAGTPFTYTITASGSPVSLNATGLPSGLAVSNAVISGTPATIGTCNIRLSAVNASGTGNGNLGLTVKPPLPVITSPAAADGLVNAAFAYTIQAANLATILGASELPDGLTLDPAKGTITGTPTNSGVYAATIGATNTTGHATSPLTIVIYNGAIPVPVITSASKATGAVGVKFGYAITATNNPTGFFAIGLPAGLFFDQASGVITGIPFAPGTNTVILRASNRGGTGSANLVLTINAEPPPQIDAVLKPDGVNLSFLALANHHYTVQCLSNLLNTNWTELVSGIVGDGTTQTVTDATTYPPARYYRLRVLTP